MTYPFKSNYYDKKSNENYCALFGLCDSLVDSDNHDDPNVHQTRPDTD